MSKDPSRTGEDGTGDAERFGHLRALVQEYQICWETRPEYAAVGGGMKQVGFVVELSAGHVHPHAAPVAGCPECTRPLRALEQIIAFVLPRGEHDSLYEVHVRWGAMQYAKRRGSRPEVSATILILHRSGFDQPVDACEQQCREEIVAGLRKLQAAEGAWPAFPGAG